MKKSKLAAITCTGMIILSGCGLTSQQRQTVSQFANACAYMGQFVAAELPSLRQATIDLDTFSAALGGPTSVLTNLDEAFDPEDVSDRVAAAQALASYGELLHALVAKLA